MQRNRIFSICIGAGLWVLSLQGVRVADDSPHTTETFKEHGKQVPPQLQEIVEDAIQRDDIDNLVDETIEQLEFLMRCRNKKAQKLWDKVTYMRFMQRIENVVREGGGFEKLSDDDCNDLRLCMEHKYVFCITSKKAKRAQVLWDKLACNNPEVALTREQRRIVSLLAYKKEELFTVEEQALFEKALRLQFNTKSPFYLP